MSTRLRRWPMLVRVLVVMLCGVLAVQVANFALLQFVELPRPPSFTVEQVAGALRSRDDIGGSLRFVHLAEPPAPEGGRAVPLGRRLAADLGITARSVRLAFVDPPMIGLAPEPGPKAKGRSGLTGLGPGADRGSSLVGDFTAAVLQADGRWLAVRPVRSGMAAWRIRLLFWLAATIVAVAPFAWWLARWVSRPLGLFAAAAERLGRDPRARPLETGGPREIGHAAAAFNEMQRRLNRYVDDRTLMIGAIAHDLRTPLMRLTMRLEQAPPEAREAMRGDVAEMEAMIAAATAYVRDAAEPPPRRLLDLRSLAETVADEHADRGEEVAVEPGRSSVVEGDPVSLKTMIENLVANAVRYAGDARISVFEADGHAVLEVRDHGPGADPDDLPRLFEPFFRGERSRNRSTGGVGLGLASVRSTVAGHGGSVAAANRPEGGLQVSVRLPAS